MAMRVIQEDQNVMVLKDRGLPIFGIAASFAIVGVLGIIKPDLFARQVPPWVGLIGLGLAMLGEVRTVRLDRTTNKLTYVAQRILGKKIKEYPLNQVTGVVIYGKFGKRWLACTLQTGEIVSLNPGSSSVKSGGGKVTSREQRVGEMIARFLGVPLDERRAPAEID